MNQKLCIFVSSAQRELEDERVIVQNLLNTDSFLSAHCLPYFHRIEERGSGFRRMRDQMLNHGLDQPLLGTDTGYFQVSFPGPGDNLDRIRVPEKRLLVTPAIEAQLSDRQKEIIAYVLAEGSVTNRWCRTRFHVVYNTAYRDIQALVNLDIIEPLGSGRSVKYVLKGGHA
ncbi:MAG: hypothetical protein KGZ49_03760 [Syntrophaceae bacterium]|nr:hypothetical protein [Syntrophaceae bacterium]